MRRLVFVLSLPFLVSACGQRGPLYLPKDEPAAAKPAPSEQRSPAASSETTEEEQPR